MNSMKVLSVAVMMGALFAQGVVPAAESNEYVFAVEKLQKPAVVDGVVGKDEYPAGVMVMKQTPEQMEIQGKPLQAKAFHDGKVLYVGVTVPFTAGTELAKNDFWSQSDGVEVCLRSASGTNAGPTFVIHGFSTGKQDSTIHGGATEEEAAALGKVATFAAKVDKDSWTAEWAIPLAAAKITCAPGAKVDFNLGAWRSDSYEWVNWRGTLGPTYQLDNGGRLVLK